MHHLHKVTEIQVLGVKIVGSCAKFPIIVVNLMHRLLIEAVGEARLCKERGDDCIEFRSHLYRIIIRFRVIEF